MGNQASGGERHEAGRGRPSEGAHGYLLCLKEGAGSQSAGGSRRRKSALWSVLGAQDWLDMQKYTQAQKCLNEAKKMYSMLPSEYGVQKFAVAGTFSLIFKKSSRRVFPPTRLAEPTSYQLVGMMTIDVLVDEESEMFGRRQSRGMSINIAAAGAASSQTAPLTPLTPAKLPSADEQDRGSANDGFG